MTKPFFEIHTPDFFMEAHMDCPTKLQSSKVQKIQKVQKQKSTENTNNTEKY